MKMKIGYFYPTLLNLYGDDGNVQILKYRAEKRGIEVEVEKVGLETDLEGKGFELIFMGGGPDSSQKDVYKDLVTEKGEFLKEFVENGGVGLYICGSYQLFGKYYKSADGSVLDGLGIFDLYTEHFGKDKPRCIGNVVCESNLNLVSVNLSNNLVGFENHGGRTYLGEGATPLAKVSKGHGNNSEDGTEGILYKNSIGTYLHGPVLARNPHLADYLIAKSVGLDLPLSPLADAFAYNAHTASRKLKQ